MVRRKVKNNKKYNYDIEADWVIGLLCNFNCEYCISHTNKKYKNEDEGKRFIEFFNSSGKRWLLHITGGEPFLYPNFVELCEKITQKHKINLNSNLTSPLVYDFAKRIDPSRVTFINVGLHIVERERNNLVDDFVKKYKYLESKGFSIFVSYVMYPTLFSRFERDYKYFKSLGIVISPKSLRGVFFGKRYPEAYTVREKKSFLNFSLMAEKEVENMKFTNDPIINLSLDRDFVKKKPNYKGRMCLAGKDFVRIFPDGKITRCDKKTKIGDVFEKKLDLYSKAKVCDTYSCPYFCAKYSIRPR